MGADIRIVRQVKVGDVHHLLNILVSKHRSDVVRKTQCCHEQSRLTNRRADGWAGWMRHDRPMDGSSKPQWFVDKANDARCTTAERLSSAARLSASAATNGYVSALLS